MDDRGVLGPDDDGKDDDAVKSDSGATEPSEGVYVDDANYDGWNQFSDLEPYEGSQYDGSDDTASYSYDDRQLYSHDTGSDSENSDTFSSGRYLFAMRRGVRGGRGRGASMIGSRVDRPTTPAPNPEPTFMTAEEVIARISAGMEAETDEESSVESVDGEVEDDNTRRWRRLLEDSREAERYFRDQCNEAIAELEECREECDEVRDERDQYRVRAEELTEQIHDMRGQARRAQHELHVMEERIARLQRDVRQYYRERDLAEASRRRQEEAAALAIAEGRDPALDAARQMFRDAEGELE
ncbi:hypothetical protein K488DRAFT_91585 [Vararia minispora EC-137]|uniref:Uncharacterized protein n=1 Tax=Vararia minispora EC-137 TaxID=1314806 RepID=A0ACB8Q5W0_9AGAM|nr:hypothetical protein K488DRAFT_91585 [Vararia minispora EC-137]